MSVILLEHPIHGRTQVYSIQILNEHLARGWHEVRDEKKDVRDQIDKVFEPTGTNPIYAAQLERARARDEAYKENVRAYELENSGQPKRRGRPRKHFG